MSLSTVSIMTFRPIHKTGNASSTNEEVQIGDLIKADTILGGPKKAHVYLITEIEKSDDMIIWHALHEGNVVTFNFAKRTIDTKAILSRLS